jgi:hypothetical protein
MHTKANTITALADTNVTATSTTTGSLESEHGDGAIQSYIGMGFLLCHHPRIRLSSSMVSGVENFRTGGFPQRDICSCSIGSRFSASGGVV